MLKKFWSRTKKTISRSFPKRQTSPIIHGDAISLSSTTPQISQEEQNCLVIEQSNLAVTFLGLPTNISANEQQAIAKEIVQRFIHSYQKGPSYKAGDVLYRGYFFVEHNKLRKQVTYELRVLRFLTAMQVYKEALDLVQDRQIQGTLDPEVAEITQRHLRTLAQQELDHVRATTPAESSQKVKEVLSQIETPESTATLTQGASEVSSYNEQIPQPPPQEIAHGLSPHGKESIDGDSN